MVLPSTKEIIERLKREKEEKDLSIPQIQKMCENAGLFMCLNTIRNIFAKGSEDGSFSYERTLRPIANVLLPKFWYSDDGNSMQEKILEKQLELLTRQLETERAAHKKHIGFLHQQIAYQRKMIDEKDHLILELIKSGKGEES